MKRVLAMVLQLCLLLFFLSYEDMKNYIEMLTKKAM